MDKELIERLYEVADAESDPKKAMYRFASLIAEECAKVAEQGKGEHIPDEECETTTYHNDRSFYDGWEQAHDDCADVIRATFCEKPDAEEEALQVLADEGQRLDFGYGIDATKGQQALDRLVAARSLGAPWIAGECEKP